MSFRENGKVRKKGAIYLGRVIDEENNIFYNKERGFFKYDIANNQYLPAPEGYTGALKNDQKKTNLILDYGDAFFISEIIRTMHYDKVLQKIGCRNNDTLYSMILFYVLTDVSCLHCNTWYEGNFARMLYPDADLRLQNIRDFLLFLGKEEVRQKYFKAHIDWVKENISDASALIIDGIGLSDDMETDLNHINNYDNNSVKDDNAIRLISVVQRDSGYPLIFRTIPGNINESPALTKTLAVLEEFAVNTDLVLLDDGCLTDCVIDDLCKANTAFIARLPENMKMLYDSIIKTGSADLKTNDNLIAFNERFLYVKQVNCYAGINKNEVYAYLCGDADETSVKNHKTTTEPDKFSQNIFESGNALHETFEPLGMFILISSQLLKNDEILTLYCHRLRAEQYFDFGRCWSRLNSLRTHNEKIALGHMLLCQIAATVNLYVQKLNLTYRALADLYLSLRNQKCVVCSSKIITSEAQSSAAFLYKRFNINYPNYYIKQGKSLKSFYSIPNVIPDDE